MKTYISVREKAKGPAFQLLDIPYCPHKPTKAQARFLLNFDLEALYGGAAGGGKSDALLMGALQFIHVPDYAALILRRSYTDLTQPGALLDRAQDWFGLTDARWKSMEHTWHFPSGASITFGYLKTENDKYRYQSAEFQYIAMDELTQFTETQYTYLFSRLRKPQRVSNSHPLAKVPLRMRTATNPGGTGHEWVRDRFIKNSRRNRKFFSATLKDNPHVDHTSYRRALKELDPVTRAQLERGDWDIKPAGNMFNRAWFSFADPGEQPTAGKTVRYWDLAATDDGDWTAGAKCTWTPQGIFVVEHIKRFRATPHKVEQTVRQVAIEDGRAVPVYIEQEPGASGKSLVSHYRRNVLPEFTVKADPKQKNKVAMASPWSARAEAREVVVVRGSWVGDFLDQAEAFPDVEHDDMVDAVSGAYGALTGRKGKVRLLV